MLALCHLDSKIKEISNCVGPSLIDFEKVEKHKKLSLLYLDSTVLARFAFYINGIPVFYCQQITGLLFIAKITSPRKHLVRNTGWALRILFKNNCAWGHLQ